MIHLKIGSDPEFCLYNGYVIPAREVISDRKHKNRVGCDGASATGELRPRPADCPLKHAKIVGQLIARMRRSIKNQHPTYQLRAGSMGGTSLRSLGGHIHFSCLEKSLYLTSNASSVARNLDIFLSIPLRLIEDNRYSKMRRTGIYGHWNDFRFQPHGMEYRTPSSWIISKEITEAVLCTAYVVAYETLDKELLIEEPITSSNFVSGIFPNRAELLNNLYEKIKTFTLYQTYKKQIDYLYSRAIRRETWNEDTDVWENWNIKTKRRVVTTTKQKLLVYTKDKYLAQINNRTRHVITQGTQIRVFGLAAHRTECDITTNDESLLNYLRINCPNLNVQLRSFYNNGPEIGISFNIRRNSERRNHFAKILRGIKLLCVA